MGLNKYKLGDLIIQRREKNKGFDVPIMGVSKEGFIPPKQKDADTSMYNVFYRNDFVFNPARMEINSIALNTDFEKAICSSLYEIFYVADETIILPEYLNLYVKREEFARHCAFLAYGSAREYCRVYNIAEIDIDVPDIAIQKKYVDIYQSLKKQYRICLDSSAQAQKACTNAMEELVANYECQEVGQYIHAIDRKNSNYEFGIESVRGISNTKEIMPTTKASTDQDVIGKFYIINPGEFIYNPRTDRMGGKVGMGFNNTEKPMLFSFNNLAFAMNEGAENTLLPEYLFMFFRRKEFDRFARINSWGSATELFALEDLGRYKIPIPNTSIQLSILNLFKAMKAQSTLATKLNQIMKNICPILIRGAIEEGGR